MRFGLLLGWALALVACGDDRSFDDRFNDTAGEIEQRAANLDAQIEANAGTETPEKNAGSDR